MGNRLDSAYVSVGNTRRLEASMKVRTFSPEELLSKPTVELAPFDLTAQQFIRSNLDDNDDWVLRGLWMFFRGAAEIALEK